MTFEAFLQAASPRSTSPQAANTFVEGEVHDVGPKGMRFTVRDWDGGKHVFGPAPWPMSRTEPAGADAHDHVETKPTRGTRCLVLFLGGGIDRPWILGVWSA